MAKNNAIVKEAVKEEGLIDFLELAKLLECHPSHVNKIRKRPGFPAPRMVSGKNWWKRTEIAAYIREQFRKQGVT